MTSVLKEELEILSPVFTALLFILDIYNSYFKCHVKEALITREYPHSDLD